MRHPGNESSSDSEGEEAPFQGIYFKYLDKIKIVCFLDVGDDKEEDTFRKVVQQQRDMQIKRAKEAEDKRKAAT